MRSFQAGKTGVYCKQEQWWSQASHALHWQNVMRAWQEFTMQAKLACKNLSTHCSLEILVACGPHRLLVDKRAFEQ